MNFVLASKVELIQIVFFEECSLDFKYSAAREMRRRKNLECAQRNFGFTEREERTIILLYQKGYLLRDIGTRFGRSKRSIKDKLADLHKSGLPYRSVMRWALNGMVPGHMRKVKQ